MVTCAFRTLLLLALLAPSLAGLSFCKRKHPMMQLIGCDVEFGMTKTMRAWRRANAYVRSGQHDKAVYWLQRTQAILDSPRPSRQRKEGLNAGFLLVALFVSVVIWFAKS